MDRKDEVNRTASPGLYEVNIMGVDFSIVYKERALSGKKTSAIITA